MRKSRAKLVLRPEPEEGLARPKVESECPLITYSLSDSSSQRISTNSDVTEPLLTAPNGDLMKWVRGLYEASYSKGKGQR